MTDPPSTREPCPTCRLGCPCKVEDGESCDHYGCPGRTGKEPATCPGAVLEYARHEAARASDRARQRIVQMRRLADSHTSARTIAQHVTRARGDVGRSISEHRPPVQP